MKNRSSIEAVIIHLRWEFGDSESELKLVLLDSGVPKEKLNDFVKDKGKYRVKYNKLREKMAGDERYLLSLATSLYHYLDKKRRIILEKQLRVDGYYFENGNCYHDEVVFEVIYSEIDRIVRVNDHIVAKLESMSSNDDAISYLIEHPNERVKIEDNVISCKEGATIPLNKTPSDLVSKLGFRGVARRIFFPTVTRKCIEFRNPILRSELKKRGYDENLKVKDLFLGASQDKKTQEDA